MNVLKEAAIAAITASLAISAWNAARDWQKGKKNNIVDLALDSIVTAAIAGSAAGYNYGLTENNKTKIVTSNKIRFKINKEILNYTIQQFEIKFREFIKDNSFSFSNEEKKELIKRASKISFTQQMQQDIVKKTITNKIILEYADYITSIKK